MIYKLCKTLCKNVTKINTYYLKRYNSGQNMHSDLSVLENEED